MRVPASSFRLGPETDRRLADLIQQLELSGAEVVRQAIRRLWLAECRPRKTAKKNPKKSRSGIAKGDTVV